MNKIYKLKFDKRRNELVVVSEITVGMGKEKSTGHLADLTALSPFRKLLGTLTPLAFLTGLVISLFPGMSLAAGLPTGGQVVGGQGSISTSGNQMTIHQQTQNMATNWQSFNIGKNNTVQFVQPDSSSVALNRVTGTSGSQIMGTLKANGQVFILNPNGVLFGKDARVNVAGLVASTKNINTADFMKGQYTLSGEGNPGAQVINQGSLTTTKGGYIVLAGERVSNSGSVSAPSGKVMLAAGKTVTLQLDNGGLTSVSVDGSVVNALVENRGLISATDGRVYLTAKGQNMLLNTVVNNSGTVEAKGLASRGGEIVLDGGDSGVVSQSGQLLADSQTGQGGKITLEGQNIHLAANSLTSATGKAGGGEVFVGGGWQGKDSRIKNASKVVMDKAASVDVSATDTGDGGTAVLWSDDYTNFRGTILARGGAQSGNGGQVETSSHNNLQAFGAVDTSAQSGHGGDWLLDPTDVTIVSAGDDITDNTNITETGKGTAQSLDTDTDHIFSPSASGAQILNTSIENQLNNGTNVTVRTSGTDTEGESGNITLNAAVAKTNGADAALTLEADGNITINNNITSTAGKLDISLLGAGSNTGSVWVLNSTLNSNGGNITLDQLDHKVSTAEGTQINQNALGVKISNSTLNTSGPGNSTGDITIRAYNPGVNLGANEYVNTVRNGGALLEVSGNSSLNSGNITLSGEQSGSVAQSLPVFINGATMTASGDINISGKGMNNARPAQIELRNTGNVLTAGNSITIINDSVGNRGDVLFSSSEGEGAILKAREVSVKASHNVTMVNATVASATNATLNADGNITLNGANVTGNGNISLLGAGNSTARIQVLNSTLNSNGGDITLDQLNHSTTSEDGTTVTSLNAMTVKVSNSTLNTTNTSTSAKGNISIRAYNPNVNLSASAYNNTVRNSGAMIEVSGNSTLTGDYVTLHTDLTGGNARGLPVYLNATNITADNDISLTGRSQSVTTTQTGADGTETSVTASPDTVQIELRGAGNSLTSINGNITIKNDGSSIADGVFLNGTADAKVALNAVNGTIILTGSSVNGTGVNVQNATLNATKAVIRGNSTSDTTSGSGFSLTNVTLGSSLSDLTNVTLSSAGSGAGAINILDSSVVNSSNRDTLLNMTIENLTSVNMDGTAIYNNATAWNKSYETETNPNAGWIFENTSVNASSADLKGVGFINAAINISNGSLNITNNGAAVLSDSNVTVSGGNISIVSGAGKADLTNTTLNSSSGAVSVTAQGGDFLLGAGNISAVNDITLNASGKADLTNATLNSSSGAVSVTAQGGDFLLGAGNISAVNDITLNASGKADLTNATLNSSSGAVSVTAQGGDFLLGAGNISAVNDITLNASGKADLNGGTLNSSEGNISVSAVSTTSADGISLSDNGNISAANGTVTLQGSSATGAGVRVSNAAIYAQKAVISGNSSTGYGFSLTNVTLGSNLSDLTNVTLSSAGSGAGAINILDSSVVNSSNRDTLLNMTIGGMTTVDMSGTAIYENATQAWVQDYGNASAPNNGWIFSNTTVNAASADLKGVGFNHSNLTINNGSLNITNNASSSLADNNITVTNGSFSVLAKAGSLSLSGTNITANNISVQVNRGGVLLNGAVVSSAVGGVDVVAGLGDINLSTSGITANTDISLRAMSGGVDLTNGTLNSSSGAVSVTAKDGDFLLGASNISAANNITLNASGKADLTNGTLNSSSGAVSVTAQNGDLTLGAGNISANSTVGLNSGGNITLNGANVTGNGNISLLGAGNSTARIQVLNSTLNSNGGDITLDQLNHNTTSEDGTTVTSLNAMTVKVSNSTLNTTNTSASAKGNISIRAYNPNVNLSASAYNNTVRNSGAMIEVSGNSTLTGDYVTLHTDLTGGNAGGLPVYLNATNITADNDISITSNLSGATSTGMSAIELRHNNTLNATAGNITISNLRTDTGAGNGVFLNGSSAGAVSLTAGKDIILNGSVGGKGNGVQVTNATLNSSAGAITVSASTGNIVLGGTAKLTAVDNISIRALSGAVTGGKSEVSSTSGAINVSAGTGALTLGAVNYTAGTNLSLETTSGLLSVGSNASLQAAGDINLNGSATSGDAVSISGGTLSAANGSLNLNGTANNGAGVKVQNATLNASSLAVNGSSQSGNGFSLTNVTLGSNLSDLTNVTLSSAGSGAGAINILDSSVVNSSNRDTLLNMTIENLTSVNMDGTAIYNNATAWNKSYETETNPNAGWIFENTSVNASSADLKGVGFINAAINISNGSLNITNNGAAVLSDSNVTVSGGNISIVSGAGKADLTNATLNSSSGAVSVTAQGGDLTLGAGNISAANNITLNAAAGVVSIGAANLTSVNGGININGAAAGGGTGIAITGSSSDKANISAENGTVSLNGTSVSGSGLKLDNVVLNSANAAFTGSSSDSGTGFSLTNTTLQGNLTDLNNVTLSSAGSGASVTNILDNTVVNTTNRDTLLNMSIENMTQIDMNGDTAFNGTGAWEKDYGKADNPYSGWIFNNTSINASSVNVAGVGFINSTLNISSGGLDIHNNGSVILTNNNVTVMNGSVNLSSANGSIALDSGNISASGNISIHGNASVSASGTLLNGTDINISGIEGVSLVSANVSGGNISISTQNGTVSITGSDAQNRTVLNATDNITIDGNQSISGSGYAVTLNQADLTSDNGSVSITGYNSGSGATGGVSLANVNITSMNGSGITLNGTTTSTSESARSGIMVNGGVNITANSTNGIIYMDAKRNALTNNNNYDYYHYGAMNWNGNNSVSAAEINLHGHDTVGAGIMFGDYTAYAYNGGYQVNITFTGNTTINGQGGLYGILLSNKNSYSGTPSSLTFNNGNVELLAKGDKGIFANNIKAAYVPGAIPAEFKYVLNNATLNIVTTSTNGGFGKSNINMAIQGDGNVSVTGHSSGSNAGVDTSILNTNSLNGSLALTGSSASGIGVLVAPNKSYKNVTITGTSNTGNGVVIQNNVTISGGQVNGTSGSASGRGAGVVVNGQTHEFTDIAIVGQSAGSGHGVTVNSISGENVAICGTSTGSGNGVQLNNSVISGVDITGSADNGNGIGVAGSDVTLSGTTLSGSSDNGSGVVLNSAVSADNNTVVTGNSTSGSGVVVSAGVSGAVVNGTSEAGSGVVLDGGDVSNAILQGVSTTGSGVEIAGNVSLDDVSAEAVSGTSTEGNGLLLSDGASVGITGFLTSEPVTAPVELGGSSVNGSGVATSGNVSISGVVLNGSATTDEGVGVTLGGNLTIADNISGVNASATGNGTALVLDNATINASGYADNGDNFSIDATVTGDGTAISTTGENTLTSVILNGTGTGNGSAVVINGTLSTDKDIIATSQGANGTGLELSGGTLTGTASDGSPVNITVNAGDTGTVVHVSDGDSELSNVNLNAGVNNGTTLDVSGNLTSNVDITVSTGNGTALNFSGGSIQGAPDATVTVNASATGDTGSAVKVEDGNTGALNSVILNASATDGDAVSVGGTLNTEDADINTQVNGNGTALHVNGGTIQSAGNTTVNATAATGQSVVVNNGMLNSEREGDLIVSATTETDDPAVNISGNSGVTNSQISGQNNGSGSAVVISGSLTSDGGGEIIGQTVNGSAVEVMGDTTVSGIALTGSATGSGAGVTVSGENTTLTDTTVSGTTADGTGVKVTGNLTSEGSTTVNGNATGTGSGVDVSGDVTGGSINGSATGSGAGVTVSGENTTLTDTTVSGTTADGTGVKVTGSLTSEGSTTVNGNSTGTGSGVDVSGNVTGGSINGSATGSGAGVTVSGENTTLTDTTVSGTTADGTGVKVTGNLTSEGSTTVNGNATGTGSGVDVSGSVGGGQLSGSSVDGVGIRFNDTARLSGTTVSGSSQSGAGISSEGNVQLNNVQLNASSVSGPDLSISGSLSYDRGTNIEASTISGRDGMLSETALPLPALRQGAVNADISRMNQPELDGFHDAGTPAVPVKEYRALPRNVNISICSSEGDCESFSLSSSPKDKTHISRMDALLSDGSRVKCEGGHCRYISAQSSEEKK